MMHGPPSPTVGRGLLLFAALMSALGVYLLLRHDWLTGGMWLAIAVFMAAYGTLMAGRGGRWDKVLLGIGLVAGIIAFGLAIMVTGMDF